MRGKEQYANIPSTVWATLKRVLTIISLIVLSIIIAQFFTADFIVTDEFKWLPLWHKFAYMIGTLFGVMSTYVIGFCFMECGCIACGFSYNGVDKNGKHQHDKIKSVNIKGLLTSN